MRYNLFLSLLAGTIIGAILGAIFFIVPGQLLICGPIPVDGLLLPPGVNNYVRHETLHWGVIPGLIIGFIGGFGTDATVPRGQLSKGIGVFCFIFCTISAWATQWEFLALTSWGRIAWIIIMTIVMFFIGIPFAQTISFIEKIREGGN